MDKSAVTASKLFKTSKRKESILGKLDVIGSSGALQLQTPDQVDYHPEETEELEDNVVDAPVVEQDDVKKEASPSEDESVVEPSVAVEPAPEESSEDSDSQGSEDASKEETEASSSVEAASGCSLPRTDVTDNLDLEVKDIKGYLNADMETSGVSRVASKDDKEVWVYYNDNVNLNDVMVPVIEALNRPAYTYLEFNRLARSENAVVFVVIKNDTERRKKPESETSEEAKE